MTKEILVDEIPAGVVEVEEEAEDIVGVPVDAVEFKEEVKELIKTSLAGMLTRDELVDILPGIIKEAVKSIYSKKIITKSTLAGPSNVQKELADKIISNLTDKKY